MGLEKPESAEALSEDKEAKQGNQVRDRSGETGIVEDKKTEQTENLTVEKNTEKTTNAENTEKTSKTEKVDPSDQPKIDDQTEKTHGVMDSECSATSESENADKGFWDWIKLIFDEEVGEDGEIIPWWEKFTDRDEKIDSKTNIVENKSETSSKVESKVVPKGVTDQVWVQAYEDILAGKRPFSLYDMEPLVLDGDSIQFTDYMGANDSVFHRLYWPDGLYFPILIIRTKDFSEGMEDGLGYYRSVVYSVLDDGRIRMDGFFAMGETTPLVYFKTDMNGNLIKVYDIGSVHTYKYDGSVPIRDWGFESIYNRSSGTQDYIKGELTLHKRVATDFEDLGEKDSQGAEVPHKLRVSEKTSSSSSKQEVDEYLNQLEMLEITDNTLSGYKAAVEKLISEKK